MAEEKQAEEKRHLLADRLDREPQPSTSYRPPPFSPEASHSQSHGMHQTESLGLPQFPQQHTYAVFLLMDQVTV